MGSTFRFGLSGAIAYVFPHPVGRVETGRAQRRTRCVNTLLPRSALREWRDHMAQPPRVVALLGVAAILTVMAPFQTGEAMRALPRFGYWLVMVGLGYSAGYLGHVLAQRLAPAHLWARIALAGVSTAALVLPVVHVLNGLSLGYWAGGRDLGIQAANVLVIATTIAAIFQVAYASRPRAESAPRAVPPAPPPLLDRLPLDRRGPLVSLTVEDHYVRIRTTAGEALILMRLSDAVREVGDTRGLQVHRSHWIASEQVAAARRKGDGAILSMSHGPDIPVSRANLSRIREAGLLPR